MLIVITYIASTKKIRFLGTINDHEFLQTNLQDFKEHRQRCANEAMQLYAHYVPLASFNDIEDIETVLRIGDYKKLPLPIDALETNLERVYLFEEVVKNKDEWRRVARDINSRDREPPVEDELQVSYLGTRSMKHCYSPALQHLFVNSRDLIVEALAAKHQAQAEDGHIVLDSPRGLAL